MPEAARPALDLLAGQLRDLEERIEEATARIAAVRGDDLLARRLAMIPGPGPIVSSPFAASLILSAGATLDVAAFQSARDYAAWLGLTLRAHASGGKERLRRIPKAGNVPGGLRGPTGATVPVHPAMAVLPWCHGAYQRAAGRRAVPTDQTSGWLDRMLARKLVIVAAVGLATHMARTAQAFATELEPMASHGSLARGGSYQAVPGRDRHRRRACPVAPKRCGAV